MLLVEKYSLLEFRDKTKQRSSSHRFYNLLGEANRCINNYEIMWHMLYSWKRYPNSTLKGTHELER